MNKAVVFGLLGLGMSLAIEQSACCRYTPSLDRRRLERADDSIIKTAKAIIKSSDIGTEERTSLFDMASSLMDMVRGDEKIALQIEGMLRPIAMETIPALYGDLLSLQEWLLSDKPYEQDSCPCQVFTLENVMQYFEIVSTRRAIAEQMVFRMRLELGLAKECWFRIFQEIGMVAVADMADTPIYHLGRNNFALLRHGILHGNINVVPEKRMSEPYCILDIDENMVYMGAFGFSRYSMEEQLGRDLVEVEGFGHGMLPFYLIYQDIKKYPHELVKKQSVSMDDTLGMPGKSATKALEKLSMLLRLDTPDVPDAPDYKRVYVSQLVPRVVPLSRLDVLEVFGEKLTRQWLWDPIFEAYFSEKTRTFGEELVTAPERKIVAADKDATSSSEK